MLKKSLKFFQKSSLEKRLFLEALFFLFISRLVLVFLPFRRIAPFLGQTMVESPKNLSSFQKIAGCISWAVQTASRVIPWKRKCLVQAAAAKAMLKRRHIPSTLYLGLKKEGTQGLTAHAWIRCGDQILTGAPGHLQYRVIASFGDRDNKENLPRH